MVIAFGGKFTVYSKIAGLDFMGSLLQMALGKNYEFFPWTLLGLVQIELLNNC
jgi:hypothetical protein